MQRKQLAPNHAPRLGTGLAILFGLGLVTLAGVVLATPTTFRASVAGVSLRGSDQEVTARLETRLAEFEARPLIARAGRTEFRLDPAAWQIELDTGRSVAEAREALERESLGERLRRALSGREFLAAVAYDRSRLAVSVGEWSEALNRRVADARLEAEEGDLRITPGQTGQRLSLAETLGRIGERIRHLEHETVEAPITPVAPLVEARDLEPVSLRALRWVSAPVELATAEVGYRKELTSEEIASIITVRNEAAVLALERPSSVLPAAAEQLRLVSEWKQARLRSNLEADLNNAAIETLVDDAARRIERPPRNALLAAAPGPVRIAEPALPGLSIDREAFGKRLRAALESLTERRVEIPTREEPAPVREETLEQLGIAELVAEGSSDFAGSPPNRIHNIRVGVSKFRSVLVAPDDAFSFNKVLGPVEASTGYLPELVILKDRTTPQYGGGLCQVSSTFWRGALNTGVPILSRINHSYAVRYYYPIGTDATIYLPYPDIRFRNTTGSHLLIQARVEGNKVYYSYFGTNPGWRVEFSRGADFAASVPRAESLPHYAFNEKPDGSLDTVFYRRILDGSEGVVLADRYFSHYESPDKFPRVVEN